MSNNVHSPQVYPMPVTEPQIPVVHRGHPFKSAKAHQKLLEYVVSRLELGAGQRDSLKTRYIRIDKQYSSWMKLDAEDQKRKSKQDSTGIPLAVKLNLPLMYVHLEDMLTYFMGVFAPTKGMYHVVAEGDEQSAANQLVTLMNTHNVHAAHYRGLIMACAAALRYNLGGVLTHWDKETGANMTTNDNGQLEVSQDKVLWEGNRVDALDPYNTLMDPRVHPLKLYKDGEFCATADTLSLHELTKGATEGRYFNTTELFAKAKNTETMGEYRYYVNPAKEVGLDLEGEDTESGGINGTNWFDWFGLSADNMGHSYEIVELYIWINPIQMKLIANTKAHREGRNRLEQWRITLVNGDTIVQTIPINNVHNWLPFSFGMINDDSMGIAQRSVGEIISPLQSFASFSMNAHIEATRKNIFGITYYDPDAIEYSQIPPGEVAGRIALKPAARGRDIRTLVMTNDNLLDTRQTTSNVDMTMGLLNDFFPTQQLPSQVAGIDRAIESQVATVKQGANRRQQKAARMLDVSMLRVSRFIQFYNIAQFQPNATVMSENGKQVAIAADKLRDTDLMYMVGQGLKSIDREAAAQTLKELTQMIFQSPEVAGRTNMLGLIDYIGDLEGVETNISQFALDQAPPTEGVVTGAGADESVLAKPSVGSAAP